MNEERFCRKVLFLTSPHRQYRGVSQFVYLVIYVIFFYWKPNGIDVINKITQHRLDNSTPRRRNMSVGKVCRYKIINMKNNTMSKKMTQRTKERGPRASPYSWSSLSVSRCMSIREAYLAICDIFYLKPNEINKITKPIINWGTYN